RRRRILHHIPQRVGDLRGRVELVRPDPDQDGPGEELLQPLRILRPCQSCRMGRRPCEEEVARLPETRRLAQEPDAPRPARRERPEPVGMGRPQRRRPARFGGRAEPLLRQGAMMKDTEGAPPGSAGVSQGEPDPPAHRVEGEVGAEDQGECFRKFHRLAKKAPAGTCLPGPLKRAISGGATRIRSGEWRFCRPLPYHLAMAPKGPAFVAVPDRPVKVPTSIGPAMFHAWNYSTFDGAVLSILLAFSLPSPRNPDQPAAG